MSRQRSGKQRTMPEGVKSEGRICFGIVWYATEEEADLAAEIVREHGRTYNGGWFHGMPCGRDRGFDYDDPELGRLYAVTR